MCVFVGRLVRVCVWHASCFQVMSLVIFHYFFFSCFMFRDFCVPFDFLFLLLDFSFSFVFFVFVIICFRHFLLIVIFICRRFHFSSFPFSSCVVFVNFCFRLFLVIFFRD